MATTGRSGAASKPKPKRTQKKKVAQEPLAPRPIAAIAAELWGEQERLSLPLLRKLYPLLGAPIDEKYVVETPPTKGKPFASTGLRSVQPQIDRMNEVLGLGFWRYLISYEDAGKVAKAIVLIGNDLCPLRLEDGKLIAAADPPPEILARVEGFGGVGQARSRGDLLKGAETNALKRVLARVGPGSNVYRLDFDEAPLDDRPAQEPKLAISSTEDVLKTILGRDDEIGALLRQADEKLVALGTGPDERLAQLSGAQDRRTAVALVARLDALADEEKS